MTFFRKQLPVLILAAMLLGILLIPSPVRAAEPLQGSHSEGFSSCPEEHSWGPWQEEVASDCYTKGIYFRICSNCGEVEQVVTEPSHNYEYQVTVTEPTCTKPGFITHACMCGDSYSTYNGDPLGHNLISHEAKDPTCEEIGWQAYETCDRCDYSTYAEIPATGHKYGYQHTDPTCTEPGYDIYICLNCGLREAIETEKALGHDWSEWTVTEEFAEEIIQHRICWQCGDEDTQVYPGDYLYGGKCGDDVLWTLDSAGTLTVFGTGCMEQYYGNMPWAPCQNLIKKVIVEDGLTHITWGAFSNCPNLMSAQIANTVIITHSELFYNCGALYSVKLSSSVESIGSYDFYRCFKLQEIEIPSSVRAIGSSAFFNCEALRQLTIPASVTTIGDRAFINCDALEVLFFQGDAPNFGENCFYKLTTTVYYPANNETWTEEVRQNYGGTITWVPICSDGHTWGRWETTLSPSCTLEGREIRACSLCRFTEERMLPPIGHSWGQWTLSGQNQVRTCITCNGKEYIFSGPQEGHNIGDNAYPDGHYEDGINYLYHRRWATTIKSTLVAENGGYTRVEYINGVLVIETYDADLNFLSGRGIPLELPIYGGVYLDEDYNFVVSGQLNSNEDDRVEVIRITRYTKDWVRLDQTSLYGANTTEPFNAGTLRFARSGDMLYIRTSHEMYRHTDGVRHQANVSLGIHIPTMEITDSDYAVSYSGTGYVSHSFNQFILVDGDDYIAVDHGDANPRSVVMFRCQGSAGNSTLPYFKEEIDVLKIAPNVGSYNDTGVAVGGLAASSTHYIVVGTSVDQSVYMEQRYGQRNIFITLTPKDNFSEAATQGFWLTLHPEGSGVELTPPHIVKLEDDLFLLIWTENGELRHCYISGQGELLSEIYENEAALSDCVPFLDGNRVLWYVTGTLAGSNGYLMTKNDSLPVFYQIDLSNPGKVGPAKCEHNYESAVTDPTCTEPGYTTHTCTICGHSYVDTPTDALGHDWGPWEIVTAPTMEETGLKHRLCNTCGLEETAVLPVLEFLYGDANADGTVNGKDLILLRQRLAGWEVTLNEAAADTNCDGTVNGKDLILLRQCLAGWDVVLGPQ